MLVLFQELKSTNRNQDLHVSSVAISHSQQPQCVSVVPGSQVHQSRSYIQYHNLAGYGGPIKKKRSPLAQDLIPVPLSLWIQWTSLDEPLKERM